MLASAAQQCEPALSGRRPRPMHPSPRPSPSSVNRPWASAGPAPQQQGEPALSVRRPRPMHPTPRPSPSSVNRPWASAGPARVHLAPTPALHPLGVTAPAELPELRSGFPPAVCFTCGRGLCFTPLSQSAPPLLPRLCPQVSSPCLCRCSCPANRFRYHFSRFHICVCYTVFVFLFLTYFTQHGVCFLVVFLVSSEVFNSDKGRLDRF